MKTNVIVVSLFFLLTIFSSCTIQNVAGAYQEAEPVRKVAKAETQPITQKSTVDVVKSEQKSSQAAPAAVVASAFASSRDQEEVVTNDDTKKSEPKFVPQLSAEEAVTAETIEEKVKVQPKVEEKVTPEAKNVPSEEFTVVDAENSEPLKTYHVVIGSFKYQSNAQGLQKNMKPDYSPVIVRNTKGMFRVLLISYDDFESAKNKCEELQSQFPDVWILVQRKK